MFNSPLVKKLIALALEEDLAWGDITSSLTIAESSECHADIVAKQPLVVCGTDMIPLIFHELEAEASVDILMQDGQGAGPDSILARIEGNTRDVLAAERTILNFLQRMSGVATYARTFVGQTRGMVVLDTRKTVPGWRLLDKYAMRIGGVRNHRFSLGDMVLVKNNHIDAAPGNHPGEKVRNCLKPIFERKPFYVPVEVEIRSVTELRAALDFKPQAIMLDNMRNDQLKEALGIVKEASPQTQVEVSGNVRLERVRSLEEIGVKCVAVGALSTQATGVDISLRVTGLR